MLTLLLVLLLWKPAYHAVAIGYYWLTQPKRPPAETKELTDEHLSDIVCYWYELARLISPEWLRAGLFSLVTTTSEHLFSDDKNEEEEDEDGRVQ